MHAAATATAREPRRHPPHAPAATAASTGTTYVSTPPTDASVGLSAPIASADATSATIPRDGPPRTNAQPPATSANAERNVSVANRSVHRNVAATSATPLPVAGSN